MCHEIDATGAPLDGASAKPSSLPFDVAAIGCMGLILGAFFGLAALTWAALMLAAQPVTQIDAATTAWIAAALVIGVLCCLWSVLSIALLRRREGGRKWTVRWLAGMAAMVAVASALRACQAAMALQPTIPSIWELALACLLLGFGTWALIGPLRYLNRPDIRELFAARPADPTSTSCGQS